ncbi:MAG: hypothetical protein KGJ84_13115 [Elusimicrobia bacterium]|nr:hypothetical protein [Elusimicrobiota bacterium]
MKTNCVKCGKPEKGGTDAHGMCLDCRVRSTNGPDLTCAILGRGDQGNEVVRGLDQEKNPAGCCPACHADYEGIGEVLLTDGRWAETCCNVRRALQANGRMRWTPFGEWKH